MTAPADRDGLVEVMGKEYCQTDDPCLEELAIMEDILTAIEAAGCAVVPVEATEEMANAWVRLAYQRIKRVIAGEEKAGGNSREGAKESYRAMCNASPYRPKGV